MPKRPYLTNPSMKLPTLFLSTALLASTVVIAAEEKPAAKPENTKGTVEARLKKLDVNADGSLSIEEFKRSRLGKNDPSKAEQLFKVQDKDANGLLSLEELKGSPQAKKSVSEGAQETRAPVDQKKPAPVAPEEKKATP